MGAEASRTGAIASSKAFTRPGAWNGVWLGNLVAKTSPWQTVIFFLSVFVDITGTTDGNTFFGSFGIVGGWYRAAIQQNLGPRKICWLPSRPEVSTCGGVQKCFFQKWTFACVRYHSFYTSLSCCFQRIFSTCKGRQQRLGVLGISFEFVPVLSWKGQVYRNWKMKEACIYMYSIYISLSLYIYIHTHVCNINRKWKSFCRFCSEQSFEQSAGARWTLG